MLSPRFNTVFVGLMLLAGLSAFVVSRGLTDPMRAGVQGIFEPVSWPLRTLFLRIDQRVRPQPWTDGGPNGTVRSDSALQIENQQLRVLSASLQKQLQDLKRLNADRQALGDIRQFCVPAAVTGADVGGRDALLIQATPGKIAVNQPVLYAGGLVGRVQRLSMGSAAVRLMTDVGFKVQAGFGRFVAGPDGSLQFVRVAMSPVVLSGHGEGTMISRDRDYKKDVEMTGLKVGDWAVLDDGDWPVNLQGYKLGTITRIARAKEMPLFAEITVAPLSNLLRLREVMVLTQ